METNIFNLIVLDASGSMETIKQETINGFNETVQTIKTAQKKFEEQRHLVSLVVFNSDGINTVYDCAEAETVKELNAETYVPECGTPLYDAIGKAVADLRRHVQNADKALITIITDGDENSSKEYSGSAIKVLIEEMKKKGWVFTYIGANHDVEKVASRIAIPNTLNFESDEKGTQAMFAKESNSRMKWFTRVSTGMKDLQDNFFDDEDK